jgi:hypothetical protein
MGQQLVIAATKVREDRFAEGRRMLARFVRRTSLGLDPALTRKGTTSS